MRLIDADEIGNRLIKMCKADKEKKFDVMTALAIGEFLQLPEYVPTVDPVKHGHWNFEDGFYPPKCSVCSVAVKTPGYTGKDEFYNCNFHYCPNCGAKMDEDVKA